MNTAPRFLVAKFTPDLLRMEPRNIGVVVWAGGNIAAKFAGEQANGAVSIDPPRSLHVQSRSAYRKWIEYWRVLIQKPTLPDSKGRPIARNKPEFVDQLRRHSKRQFRLVDGGEFQIEIHGNEINAVAEELFEALVTTEKEEPNRHERVEAARELSKSCKTALTESGLYNAQGFTSDYHWFCPVNDSTIPFRFDYGIHRVKPVAVMSRVYLWKHDSLYGKAFEFRAMKEAYSLSREKCAAMI
jgi:hypothetical protein